MAKASLTKAEIAKALAEKWELTEQEAEQAFEDVLEVLAQGLERGERVYLDDFGSLAAKVKPEAKNKFVPGIGLTTIPAHVVVRFKPFGPLVDRLSDELLK